MPPTVPQDSPLVNHLLQLLALHRPLFSQERIYQRVVALVFAELFTFGRHTVTQLLMTLGLNEWDWSAWYRLFSAERFDVEGAAQVLFEQTLQYVPADGVYVVAGDGTQVPRSSQRMEGSSWLHCLLTPVFKRGIHRAQRWFNGSWLLPPEEGYSRAMPLRWLPAFPEKAVRQISAACREWQAALQFLSWLRDQLAAQGRSQQPILMLADGSYDTVELWKALPSGVILLARSAKNRRLHYLPTPSSGRGRRPKYGERAPTPQQIWQDQDTPWQSTTLLIRGRRRRLQYHVSGPLLRYGAPDTPLFLIVVRGQTYSQHGRRKRREPVPYLVNAIQNANGEWVLPLPIDTLLFWAWQRWEVEVCHRELKSSLGLGDKQCFNPHAAILSVQWTAWVYALLLLAAYQTWGLCAAPPVPTRWWRGSGRWSFNTLWRAYRAELWGQPYFRPLWHPSPTNWWEKDDFLAALTHSVHAAARL